MWTSILLVILGLVLGVVLCWLALAALASQWRPPWW
jgi:hypothetical protein